MSVKSQDIAIERDTAEININDISVAANNLGELKLKLFAWDMSDNKIAPVTAAETVLINDGTSLHYINDISLSEAEVLPAADMPNEQEDSAEILPEVKVEDIENIEDIDLSEIL